MIALSLSHDTGEPPLDPERLAELFTATCREHGVTRAEISVAVLDDETMTHLNRQYKQRPRTTDCFSFDLSDPEDAAAPRSFEILVNGALARREAAVRAHGPAAELTLYALHGLLHLLGFDDQTEAQAARMHAREDEILGRFGFGRVYNGADE